jgi:hypothetical protein
MTRYPAVLNSHCRARVSSLRLLFERVETPLGCRLAAFLGLAEVATAYARATEEGASGSPPKASAVPSTPMSRQSEYADL